MQDSPVSFLTAIVLPASGTINSVVSSPTTVCLIKEVKKGLWFDIDDPLVADTWNRIIM